MKTSIARLATCTVLAAALTAGAGGDASAQRVLKLGHVYETGHPMHVGAVEAAALMSDCSGGSVSIDVFPSSQLGKETALNEQIRFGGVDIMFTGAIFGSSAYSPLAISAAPYIFNDRDHALRYRTSDVYKELWQGWTDATGAHILSAGYFGAFNVSSNEPVHTPADLAGVKVRVPDAPIWMAFPRAVGANPTPIAFAEVYIALQQGVASASVNPLPVTYAKKFYEVQEYVNLTGHLIEFVFWAVGDHVWSALSENERACMQQSADVFGARSTELVVGQEDSLREQMTSEGLIKFVEPDVEAFQAATQNVLKEMEAELNVPAGIVERIRDL
jgi:tripartite ATP-independent transporter DctP family solute receptor